MRKSLKKGLFLLAFIGGIFTGCGKQGEDLKELSDREASESIEVNSTAEEYTYVPQVFEYDRKYEWINSVVTLDEESVLVLGNWYYAEPFSEALMIDVETGASETFSFGLPKERYISGCTKTESGYVVFSESYHEAKEEYALATWTGAYLTYFNKEFELLSEVDITEYCRLEKNSNSFSFEHMTVDAVGNIYFSCQNEIHILDRTGKKFTKVTVTAGTVYSMAAVGSQVMILYVDKGGSLLVAPIDLDGAKLGKDLPNIAIQAYEGELLSDSRDGFFMITNESLFHYQLDTESLEEVFQWSDADINQLGQFCTMAGERIISTNCLYPGFELIILEKKKKSEIPEKTTITLAMLYEDNELLEQVMKFNRKNLKIRIEPKIYFTYDRWNCPPEAKEEAITQFQIDLVTGAAGDIIFVNQEMDFRNLASKGAFVDLDRFLEKDATVSKTDFIENITDTLMSEDKLYGIAPYFTIRSLVGKASNIGATGSFTVTDIQRMLAEHQGAKLLPACRKADVLRMFLYYNMDAYYDAQTGVCSFDREDFQTILQIANSFPDSYTSEEFPEEGGASSLREEKVLLNEFNNNYWFYALQFHRAMFGEEVTVTGYPVSVGSGNCASFGQGVYAISTGSEKQEEAWLFIRELLTEENQKQYIAYEESRTVEKRFPIRKDVFEQGITKAMTIEPEVKLCQYDDVTFELELLSEADAAYFRELVYGIHCNDFVDYQMYCMIMEEAEAYFSGGKTLEEAIKIIQNRVQLYVDER